MDFCSSFLKSRIECFSPCSDDYPVENLISPSPRARSCGFLSEGFVRPPVDVDLTFSAPVDVYHVIFRTRVQYKQSTAFALFTVPQTSPDSEPIRIGQFYTNKEDTLHLTNARLHRWYRYPQQLRARKLAEYDRKATSVLVGKLRHSDPEALQNVRRLKIRILRNASTGGSGLADLEVWGRPGTMASKEERVGAIDGWGQHYVLHYINNASLGALENTQNIADAQANAKYDFYCDMFKQITDIIPGGEKPSIPIESQNCNDKREHISPDYDVENSNIPEEYLDPITCNLMVTPMLLPSGNSVDITTLEKFISSQRCYNRSPCDPFTGITFNTLVQPVPNTRLKARIDRFVLLNQRDPDLHDVGRSLLPVSALAPGPSPNLVEPPSQERSCADGINREADRNSLVATNINEHPGETSRKIVAGGSASANCYNINKTKRSTNQNIIENSSVEGSIECDSDDITCDNTSKRKTCSDSSTATTNTTPVKCSRSSEFVSKFRAVNADGFLQNIPNSTAAVPLPPGGHSGLPQLVTRPKRSTAVPLSSVPSSKGKTTRPGLRNTLLSRNPSSSIPLSRSLLNAKPSKLIQGDAEPPQFSAFSQQALLSSDDQCPKCGGSDQLYVLETCRHLLCRGCLGSEESSSGRSEVTCSVCSAAVLRKEVSKHHSKSVFSR